MDTENNFEQYKKIIFNELNHYQFNEEQFKWINDAYKNISSKRKSKITYDKKYNLKKSIEIKVFFNGLYYRIIDLVDSILLNLENKKYLSCIMLSRHLIETLATIIYFIGHSKKYLENQKYIEHFKLIWRLNAQPEDIDKKLHINDILRYYQKFLHKSYDTSKLNEKIYSNISDIAHPNYNGVTQFYSKKYPNNRILFRNFQESSINKTQMAIMQCFMNLPKIADEIEKYEEFINKNWEKIMSQYLRDRKLVEEYENAADEFWSKKSKS